MQWEWSYVMIIGTVVTLMGFLKWPKSSYELIHPRFVVPGIIWLGTFGQAMLRDVGTSDVDRMYESARIEYGNAALWYTIFAMLCFYLGMMLPIGAWISSPFARLETQFQINPQRLRRLGWIGTWTLFVFFIALVGPQALGLGSIGPIIPIPESMFKLVAILLTVCSVFNAVMLGMSWPEPGQRTFLTYAGMALGLFINSIYTMPVMSRGVGLPVFVAAMAYSVRVRRFKLSIMLPAIVWVALCGHAGLVGRAYYGRRSDVITYLSVLFQYSIYDPAQVFRSGMGLNDGFTALAMSMKAITRVDVGQLTKINWLIFQLPIPHWFNFMPEWTLDLTIFIGGAGTWGYTVGMLGDTFIHWGWFGPLWFIPVGITYRLVSELVFSPKSLQAGRISIYSLVLFSGYFAIGSGVFNTYRAWETAFIIPTGLVVLFLVLRRLFVTPDQDTSIDPHWNVVPQEQAGGWM
jgi:hypothetical protein